MTLFSCRCPHQRGRDGRDLLAHGSQSSGRSGPALYFFLCFVQSKLSRSVEFLSFPHVFRMQKTGAELSSLAFSLRPTISEELKGWTFYQVSLESSVLVLYHSSIGVTDLGTQSPLKDKTKTCT